MNYKKLGDYIQEVNIRNRDLNVDKLLGVSIQKEMIISIANTVGTDMSTYKVIKKGQFAYGPVTSRNGDKISVALQNKYDQAIISQVYISFEVIDENLLLPEYLMMWFRRPEFDRYARFKSHGSAREIFDWTEMCNIELPIPSIEKQREIVAEYNALQKRIDLNNQLIQKLEETAQTIYKQWFVDFEFPDEPQRSLSEFIELNPIHNMVRDQEYPYIEMADLSETSMCISNKITRKYGGGSKFRNGDTLLARITPCLENGKTAFVSILERGEIAFGSTEFIVMRAKKNVSPFWVYCLAKDESFRSYAISSMIGSSGRQRVHDKYLNEFKLANFSKEAMISFNNNVKPVFESIHTIHAENSLLKKLLLIVLSKMSRIV